MEQLNGGPPLAPIQQKFTSLDPAATALARIKIINARRLTDLEVIPQAMKLNPAFFKIVYSDLLNTKKTAKRSASDLY